jgi:hypothetical protein
MPGLLIGYWPVVQFATDVPSTLITINTFASHTLIGTTQDARL